MAGLLSVHKPDGSVVLATTFHAPAAKSPTSNWVPDELSAASGLSPVAASTADEGTTSKNCRADVVGYENPEVPKTLSLLRPAPSTNHSLISPDGS